jgi:hypothetical protein
LDQPLSTDAVYAQMLKDPSVASQAGALLTNNQITEQLNRDTYGHQAAAQQDYANRVLGVQNRNETLNSLVSSLDKPSGFAIMSGNQDVRDVLNRMSPEDMGTIARQSFLSTQSDLAKKGYETAKTAADAGYNIDPKIISAFTGLLSQAGTPMSLQLEDLKGRYGLAQEQIKANTPGPQTVPSAPQPGLGDAVVTGSYPASWTVDQIREWRKAHGQVPAPAVKPPPAGSRPPTTSLKPNADNPLLTPGSETPPPLPVPPAGKNAATEVIPPPLIPGVAPKDLYTSPDFGQKEWNDYKNAPGPALPPEQVANVERLMSQNGNRVLFNRRTGKIMGVDAKGKYYEYDN